MAQGKVRGRIAKAAISAALTGVMAFGGVMASASVALAAPTENKITVKNAESGDTYDFYQIFVGTVKPGTSETKGEVFKPEFKDEEGNVTFQWAEGVKDALWNFFETYNNGEYLQWLVDRAVLTSTTPSTFTTDDYAKAQDPKNVVGFISEQIYGDEQAGASINELAEAVNNKKHVTLDGTFANALAAAVKTAGVSKLNADAGKSVANAQNGYVLVVPTSSTNGEDPVWLAVESTAEQTSFDITKKDGFPTLLKQIRDNGDGENAEYSKADDVDMAEKLDYKLTVTIPAGTKDENFTVTDTIPAGVTFDATSPMIQEGDDTPAAFEEGKVTTAPGEDGATVVTFTGATGGSDSSATSAEKTFTITYSGNVNYKATLGDAGNKNSAILKVGDYETIENDAKAYTYQLQLDKVDADGSAVAGAGFVIKKGDKFIKYDAAADKAEPVDSEDAATVFTVDGNGHIDVPFFVDAETYTIIEQVAPQGYEKIDDFDVTITSEIDPETGELKSLTAEAGEGTTAEVEVDTEGEIKNGIIKVKIPNDNEIILPITGMTPSQLGTLIGALLVAVGAVTIMARRRQNAQA